MPQAAACCLYSRARTTNTAAIVGHYLMPAPPRAVVDPSSPPIPLRFRMALLLGGAVDHPVLAELVGERGIIIAPELLADGHFDHAACG